VSPPDPGGAGDMWEYTRCWDQSMSIVVRIIDICPCQYPSDKSGTLLRYGHILH